MKATLVLLLSLFLLPISSAHAQASGKGTVQTVTKYVLQFGALEKELLQAQSQKDAKRLDQLLASTFEVRKANGEKVTRPEWLQQVHPMNTTPDISGLVVYEVGENAVASFWLNTDNGKDGTFVTDVWTRQEGAWVLRVRFESVMPTAK